MRTSAKGEGYIYTCCSPLSRTDDRQLSKLLENSSRQLENASTCWNVLELAWWRSRCSNGSRDRHRCYGCCGNQLGLSSDRNFSKFHRTALATTLKTL